MMSRHDDDWWYYTPAAPLPVAGGIRAKSTRGRFGKNWWGRQWVQTLESFNIGARLGRGRGYARDGQVADLRIGAGEVSAKVQGTRRQPYEVRIFLHAFRSEDWQKVMRKLRRMPIEVAQLLNGEMPEALDNLFEKSGLYLFPRASRDLKTECSCPDWSNPCKHIAAVYYLLAEAFDDDPFLLLRLRGMDREQFLAQLQTAAARRVAESPKGAEGVALPLDHHSFWTPSPPATVVPRAAEPQPVPILAGLTEPPFWRSERLFTETLSVLYSHAAETAREYVVFGEEVEEEFDEAE
jgi:uncharacterized Zn finger protein